MFFLIDQGDSFPITFPAVFQIGVNMNEALRQPMEFTQPKVISHQVFPALCVHAVGPADIPGQR